MAFTSEELHVGTVDEQQLAAYRRVSVAAVIALVLGVASSLALTYWLLWVLPMIAVVVAIVALRAIDTPGSNLTGRGFAVIGLVLALIFGLWAPTRAYTRQQHIYSQARPFADEWLELIRTGQLREAHQLTLRQAERQLTGVDLAEFYAKSSEAKGEYDRFATERFLKKLAEQGDRVTYTYVGGAELPPADMTGQTVMLGYRASWDDNGTPREVPLRVVLHRQQQADPSTYLWRIQGLVDPRREK
ncbi:MAG TPA: DUF4190 domain-containing protein [Pirellulaceae bacterium]|nr:DUF4190 domain-containing protein [Pirellulaceae bacterium]